MKNQVAKLTYNDLTIIPDLREDVPIISNIQNILPEDLDELKINLKYSKKFSVGKMNDKLDI